jgi:hypothetical protein
VLLNGVGKGVERDLIHKEQERPEVWGILSAASRAQVQGNCSNA